MKRRYDIVLLASFIFLGCLYFIYDTQSTQESQKSASLLPGSEGDTLKEIVLSGHYKNQMQARNQKQKWIWERKALVSLPLEFQSAYVALRSVRLTEKLSLDLIPSAFFKGAKSITLVPKTGESVKISVSPKKSVTGERYLSKEQGAKKEYYLFDGAEMPKFKFKIVEWLGDSMFPENLEGLEKIKYYNDHQVQTAHWQLDGDIALFQKDKLQFEVSTKVLLEKLSGLRIHEAYSISSFSTIELLEMGISEDGIGMDRVVFSFGDGQEHLFFLSRMKGKENFFYDVSRKLILSSLNSQLKFLKQDFVGIFPWEDYHLSAVENVQRIQCELLKKGEVAEFQYREKEFWSGSRRLDFKGFMESIYRLEPTSMLFGKMKSSEFDFKVTLQQKDLGDLVYGLTYVDDKLFLQRQDRPYYYQLAEFSSKDLGRLVSFCFKENKQ